MESYFVSCPYDKCHRVLQKRIQAHIVKCQKKYPPLEICAYNATHRMTKEEMLDHIMVCPSKPEEIPTWPEKLPIIRNINPDIVCVMEDEPEEVWDLSGSKDDENKKSGQNKKSI